MQYTYRRRYITRGLLLLLPATAVGAQDRDLQRHTFGEQEGRLLGFYSATMAFTPAGLLPDESRLALGVEITHVPRLNEAQRRPSIDKPEATNLAPFFPRPRAVARIGSWRAEASWIPPIRIFDVEANLAGAALYAPKLDVAGVSLAPRVWAMAGRVRGAMTCASSELLGRGGDLQTYYEKVCHGRESEDWFEPRMAGAEVVGSRELGTTGLQLYALLGARVDRTRFDIGVMTEEGARDPDHPILELHAARPHVALGAARRIRGSGAAGAEVFYAPGSVLTARVSVRMAVRR
jgi:hypothetical protein